MFDLFNFVDFYETCYMGTGNKGVLEERVSEAVGKAKFGVKYIVPKLFRLKQLKCKAIFLTRNVCYKC